MNHADLSNGSLPSRLARRDLPSEAGPSKACTEVAALVASFVDSHLAARPSADDVPPSKHSARAPLPDAAAVAGDAFAPFVSLFVEQEGSWWWAGNTDERGSSAWAAHAQQLMAEPLPAAQSEAGVGEPGVGEPGVGEAHPLQWEVHNAFHLLSDEEKIPPYYRKKHRASVTLEGTTLVSTTVAQLRYVSLTNGTSTVLPPLISEDGWAIIKEEKAGVLSALIDDGAEYTSAIEIATKLASRQFVFNLTGAAAPATLDDGSRCQMINQAAYELALSSASPAARARFLAHGRPLTTVPDRTPIPNGGPWFIWNYLQYNECADGMAVQSWASFTPLDGLAYGAGTHYCKLLSPARALEWIYTDGLRHAEL